MALSPSLARSNQVARSAVRAERHRLRSVVGEVYVPQATCGVLSNLGTPLDRWRNDYRHVYSDGSSTIHSVDQVLELSIAQMLKKQVFNVSHLKP